MALKLDISEAYDRVEWHFLKVVMIKMRFASRWTYLIMNYVITISYSILIDGVPQRGFKPSEGIRQGSIIPLPIHPMFGSPQLLNHAEEKGCIIGIPLTQDSLYINHIFFCK